MAEWLVEMEFHFPGLWTHDTMQEHYTEEAHRASQLAETGLFKRVWRVPGRRGHISLWEAPDADVLHRALESWPMFMFMSITVKPLAINHNDPGGVAEGYPDVQFTYPVLRSILDDHHAHSEDTGYVLPGGDDTISIHDHPGTDRSRQIHVMCKNLDETWQKIAEIGPPVLDPNSHESVIPGYIDFLVEWDKRPVRHVQWQRRIERDNNLLNLNYEEALTHPRFSRRLIRGQ